MESRKEQNLEKQIERQMSCMPGFLQIFHRHHSLSGKLVYSTKRLPSSRVINTASDLDISTTALPSNSRELEPASPELQIQSTEGEVTNFLTPKSPSQFPVFNLKDGSKSPWKFYRESPRLSLDSRATMDAKGGLRSKEIQRTESPSVVARLMGLEPLPISFDSETEKTPQLRRSASESRASRDISQSRFITEGTHTFSKGVKKDIQLNSECEDPRDHSLKRSNKAGLSEGLNRVSSCSPPSPWRVSQQRKSFFDSGDIFPEQKQNPSIYGEIEKRLRMRGIDEASKDLETLKQILEALQLKGLLHSKKPSNPDQVSRRIFVYDESPIVLMRPSRSPNSRLSTINKRNVGDLSLSHCGNHVRRPSRRFGFAGENSPSVSPRRDLCLTSPRTRNERNLSTRRSNSPVKSKPTSVGTQTRLNGSTGNRRVAVSQPPRRTRPDQTANNGSNRSKKTRAESKIHREIITTTVVEDDESSSFSGSSVSTSTDTEMLKIVECKEGCDKLLNSIAEMNETDTQPSPVSVLDSSFYKDESSTPSPVTTKRNLDFKDESVDLVEEILSPVISPIQSKCGENLDDSDFAYISEILRASRCRSEDSDIFTLLEKQKYHKGKDTSKVSRLQRKLIFDTTIEILDRNRELPPWKTVSWYKHGSHKSSLDKVYSEFQRIREPNAAVDLFGVICGLLKRDLSAAGDEITGWEDYLAEKLRAVLDMERMIFKDLLAETVQDLAALACGSSSLSCQIMSRRKLVF